MNDKNEHPSLIRRKILTLLYERFKETPYADVELSRVAEECGLEAKDLNWNLVYLEKCGFVRLGKSVECRPWIACSVSLTAEGIDLLEDGDRFDRKFPPGAMAAER